jgi:hypothetical protein
MYKKTVPIAVLALTVIVIVLGIKELLPRKLSSLAPVAVQIEEAKLPLSLANFKHPEKSHEENGLLFIEQPIRIPFGEYFATNATEWIGTITEPVKIQVELA